MAFTSLFSSLPNKEFDTTPCEPIEGFQRDERQLETVQLEKKNERDAQSRKWPLQRGQQSGPRKRKKGDQQCGQAKKSKLHKCPPQSYKDFDSVARDYNTVKCDFEQPGFDFSRDLDFYNDSKEGASPGHATEKSGWKNMRPGEAKDPDQKDVQGVNKKKGQEQKRQQWEPQQQRLDNQARGRGGNSARRGGDFTGMGGRGTDQPRDFSNRGGGGSNRGGGGSNRGGGGSNRGGGGSNRGGGGSNRGGGGSNRGGGGSNRGREWSNRGRDCDKRGSFLRRGDWSKRGTDRSRSGGRQFPDDGRLTLETLTGNGKKNMTKEFKDQNALEIDGRLICRHFLRGNCIKGDDCQLEHALDVNYSINEVCKFYVQGSCSKGESCIYMHKSFPCKFFHTYEKCCQGDQCRFSHEPLTELTKQLLEAALKRDKDIEELAKKDKPISMEESVVTKESATADETKPVIDIFLNPLRPNFYNSSCPSEPHAEESTPVCQNEVSAEVVEKEIAPPTESIRSPDPPPSSPGFKEPVSYSVEAVLGSHRPLEKPFRSFLAASISQTSQTQPDPPTTTLVPPDSIHPRDPPLNSTCGKRNVPYSVKAVLGFQKPVEKPVCSQFSGSINQTFTPPTQIHSDPPSTTLVSPDPISLSFPRLNKRQASYSVEAFSTAQKPVKKTFCSLFAGPISQTSTRPLIQNSVNSPINTPGCKRPASYSVKAVLKSHQPVENPSRSLVAGPITQSSRHSDIQTQLDRPSTTLNPPDSIMPPDPPSGYKRLAYNSAKAVLGSPKPLKPSFSSLFAGPISQTSPQPPTQTQADSSSATFGPSDSAPPAGCKRPASYSVTAVLETYKPVENPFHSRLAGTISQTTPDPPSQSLNSPGCKAPASKKPMEKPFRSFFEGPISQTPTNHPPRQTQPNPPITAFGPPDPIRSSEPLPVCKRRTSSVEAVSETQKSMEKPFRRLFAGPLTQTSTAGHPTQTQPDPPRNFTGKRPAYHSLEAMLETQKPVGKPFRSLFAGPISQTTHPDPPTQTRPYPPIVEPKQEEPDPTPFTEPSTTHSVLRTLFLRLSPCRQEGEPEISNSCKVPGGDGLCSSEDEITRGSTSTGEQSQKVDELESEREEPEECVLRDELLVIPLEPLVPYVPLGDPRHHRQADITLPRSTFVQDVVWSFEDLAPLPPLSLHHQPSVPLASRSSERTSGPAVGLSGPAVGLSGPAVGLSGPAVGLSGPAVGLSGPAVGLSGPAVGLSGPAVGLSGPAVGLSGPAVGLSGPAVGLSGPAVGLSGPAVGLSGPAVGLSGPAVGLSGPAVGLSGPAVGLSGPAVGLSGPAVGLSGPAVGLSGPAVGLSGPAVGLSGPAVGLSGPAVGLSGPAVGLSGPAVGLSGPAVGLSGPAVGLSGPAVGLSGPAVGLSGPAVGLSGPAVGLSGPAVGLSGPAGLRPQTSSQDSNSQEAAGELLIPSRNSDRRQVQVGTPGVHNLPIQAMVWITRRNTDVQPKRLSGQMRCKSGNVGDTKTLKDLFKTFDPTSSPFGQ
ncbi:zinc finger CCCH domain-containing protein 4-like isoform X2 [Salvelinus fontinalis]|uniref:zinc finger CCCH domain-containing protein 4-like isoform X2 n=1 Tax=Salvelinus fontinalis TaxID=8038 RepID=UPI0024859B21|nr:zinc finger CCCH domain-containing protein 4-like isoform X2 [Salvelinus fontinalis]